MNKDSRPPAGPDPDRQSRAILYTTPDGRVTVDVFFAQDNFWLTQRTMAELFGVKTPAVSEHLRNVFDSGGGWPEIQLFPFWKQLPPTAKSTKPNSAISTRPRSQSKIRTRLLWQKPHAIAGVRPSTRHYLASGGPNCSAF